MSYTEDRAIGSKGRGCGSIFRSRLAGLELAAEKPHHERRQLEQFMTLTPEEKGGCLFADQKLALAITPYFFNLIDRKDPDCRSVVRSFPAATKMVVSEEEMLDSWAKDAHSPVRDWCTAIPTGAVPGDRPLRSLLRYCTRSRLVSNAQDYNFHPEHERALRYIEAHPRCASPAQRGDPLLLSDRKLDHLLGRLRAIKHVEFIRIGSRIPVFLPQRITPELCELFRKHGPIWMSIHVNHPKECTQELKDACERWRLPVFRWAIRACSPGVNDDADVMKALMHRLLRMRVRPYYLYQMT